MIRILQADHDYMGVKNGRVTFEPEEVEKYVDIEIIDDKQDEKDETFLVTVTRVDTQGTVTTSYWFFNTFMRIYNWYLWNTADVPITSKLRTTVTIISDDNALKNVTNVRKLMRNYLKDMKLERASWTEQVCFDWVYFINNVQIIDVNTNPLQIINASSVNGGDIHNATFCDAIKHGSYFCKLSFQ